MKEFSLKTEQNNNTAFPKYALPLINLANQFAQATRPKSIGCLSELFSNYKKENTKRSVSGWKKWYMNNHPDIIDNAVDKIYDMLQNMKSAIDNVNKDMIKEWLEHLVFEKTYEGLSVQEKILSILATEQDVSYRMATPEEESKGIDGYIGNIPYSIKPNTYKSMSRLPEQIDVKIIFYEKKNDKIIFDNI